MSAKPTQDPQAAKATGARADADSASGAATSSSAEGGDGVAVRLRRAYQAYVDEVNRAWQPDDLPTRLQEEHRRFAEAVRAALGEEVDPGQRVLEAQKELARGLRDALAPEQLAEGFAEAFRAYVRELRDAWSAVKPEEADVAVVGALGEATCAGLSLAAESAAALRHRAGVVAPLEAATR